MPLPLFCQSAPRQDPPRPTGSRLWGVKGHSRQQLWLTREKHADKAPVQTLPGGTLCTRQTPTRENRVSPHLQPLQPNAVQTLGGQPAACSSLAGAAGRKSSLRTGLLHLEVQTWGGRRAVCPLGQEAASMGCLDHYSWQAASDVFASFP